MIHHFYGKPVLADLSGLLVTSFMRLSSLARVSTCILNYLNSELKQ